MSTYRDDFYREPDLYDVEYAHLREDLGHYARLAATAGEVLELGAGTGRVTLAMARTGARVQALDLSKQMLDRLARRLADEPQLKVDLQQGDFRNLPEGPRVPLITMPFNAIHHLYTAREVLDFFAGVKQRLTRSGRFAMDMLVPQPAFFDREPDGVYELRRFPDPMGGMMKSWENGWYDPITQVNHVRYHYRRADGRAQVLEVPLRMFYPQEFLGLVDLAGWRLQTCDADFEGRPLASGATKIVLVMTPA